MFHYIVIHYAQASSHECPQVIGKFELIMHRCCVYILLLELTVKLFQKSKNKLLMTDEKVITQHQLELFTVLFILFVKNAFTVKQRLCCEQTLLISECGININKITENTEGGTTSLKLPGRTFLLL